jgi:hypothetical protein
MITQRNVSNKCDAVPDPDRTFDELCPSFSFHSGRRVYGRLPSMDQDLKIINHTLRTNSRNYPGLLREMNRLPTGMRIAIQIILIMLFVQWTKSGCPQCFHIKSKIFLTFQQIYWRNVSTSKRIDNSTHIYNNICAMGTSRHRG